MSDKVHDHSIYNLLLIFELINKQTMIKTHNGCIELAAAILHFSVSNLVGWLLSSLEYSEKNRRILRLFLFKFI